MAKRKSFFGKKPQQESAQNGDQAFLEAYRQLCEQHRRQVVIIPVWMARDDGTWSMRLTRQVGPYQPEG